MRKHHIKQINNILQTINQAQNLGLYVDCQEGALGVCDFIEKHEGKETKTVELLEEYCELLFKAHNNEIGEKVLKKHFIKIENSIKYEFKPMFEVVFLSYKASMSDSIETVYLSAKDDPGCDAYFIPIPYFDRRQDGTLGEMHYEGAECYGKNIEITDWQTYDIEARRPDAIFTFNPYDGINLVTCIHPDFFCERLRNLTDMLVYIPYFVGGDTVAEHLCTLPGCAYAHKVIIQSETLREFYIKNFKATYGDKFGKSEDKFVAFGSPKFDKVLNSKREDFALPKEWRELIGEKKAIFFNTSLAAMLEGNEQYLKKLKLILESFHNRDDVVLWWRPHPLDEAAYQSMRPQLLDEYMTIINQYKNDGWGIYDDSPELHRAIARTDAYYGDPSSVAVLYQVTGKPVMIANNNAKPGKVSYIPSFLCDCDNYIWFLIRGFNGLYKLDKKTYCVSYVDDLPIKGNHIFNKNLPLLYGDSVESDGNIFFSPCEAKEIAIFSIKNNSFEQLPFNRNIGASITSKSFTGAVKFEEYIFFTPHLYPAIIALNTKTREIDYYSESITVVGTSGTFCRPLVVHKSLWLVNRGASVVLEFNMETRSFVIHEVGQYQGFHSICFCDANFWIFPVSYIQGVILKWHPKTGVIKELKEFQEIYRENKIKWRNTFFNSIYSHGYVWLLPIHSKHAFKIDVNSYEISHAQPFEDILSQISDDYINFNHACCFKNKIYIFMSIDETLVEYNVNTKECTAVKLDIYEMVNAKRVEFIAEAFQTKKVYEELANSDGFLYEGYAICLSEFIAFTYSRITQNLPEASIIGKKIFNYIKSHF